MPSSFDITDASRRERLMRQRAMLDNDPPPRSKWTPLVEEGGDELEWSETFGRGRGNALGAMMWIVIALVCIYAAGYLIFFA